MVYIKINGALYPASISGRINDATWNGRSSKTIRLTMSPADAAAIFINDTPWSVIDEYVNEDEQIVQIEYDNSDYCVAGDIIDHRDGTISVKMGKATDAEIIAILMGGAE